MSRVSLSTIVLVSFLLSLLALPVVAGNDPPLPSPLPPLQKLRPYPPSQAPAGPPLPPVELTPEVLARTPMSTSVYYSFLAALRKKHASPLNVSATALPSDATAGERPFGPSEAVAVVAPARGRRHIAEPLTGPYGTYRDTNDAAEDTETSLARFNFCGADTTLVAYMKTDTAGQEPAHIYTYWRDGNPSCIGSNAQLQLPAGYPNSADPWVGVNPNQGYNPHAFYIAGMAYNASANGPSQVLVWHMEEYNNVFHSVVVDSAANNQHLLDKPSLAVSRHAGTLGMVYVALTDLTFGSANTTIKLYRATFDQWGSITGFEKSPVEFTGSRYHSPLVFVDSYYGTVYLAWLAWGDCTGADGRIYMAYSTDMGQTFSTPQYFDATRINDATTGSLLGPECSGAVNAVDKHDSICDTSNACVVARTTLQGRYNPYQNSIGIVWHRRSGTGSPIGQVRTDVAFNFFSTVSHNWYYPTTNPVAYSPRIPTPSAGDKWNPALDYDLSGNYMVTWFDRRRDPQNRKYDLFATYINSIGNRLEANDADVSDIYAGSDPTKYAAQPDGRYFLGEYHGNWSWYTDNRVVWFTGYPWIYWATNQGDLWESSVIY